MAAPQRSWSILLQTVPGASRSARLTEACKHGGTATWLEHPAPDRARSVPLRKANVGVQAWRHRNVAGASCSRPCPERPAPQG